MPAHRPHPARLSRSRRTGARAANGADFPAIRRIFGQVVGAGAFRHPSCGAIDVLIMHGARDTLVPSSMGERLYHAATAPDRQFWHIEDASHNDLAEHGAVDAGIAFVEQRLVRR